LKGRKVFIVFLIIATLIQVGCRNDKKNSWDSSATLYEVNLRQYTEEGTIAAFLEKLPRIKELGIKTLWFMPVHPVSETKRKGELGSVYAVSNYREINSEFGTIDEFINLVNICHENGFDVILDWVAGHTGWDHPWIELHPDWYLSKNGKIISPEGTDWTDVADLDFRNDDMKKAMIEDMKYWIDEVGIDGFRCDAAWSVPTSFWEELSVEIENNDRDIFLLAEDGSKQELLDKAFDSNYNWALLNDMQKAAKNTINSSQMRMSLKNSESRYKNGDFPLNFVTNHDENTWHGSVDERFGDSKKLMIAYTFTIPGMPLVYSGQEIGLDKRLKFFEKDNIEWDYSNDMFEFHKKLIHLKNDNKALWHGKGGGKLKLLKASSRPIIAFERYSGDDRVIFIGNFSATTKIFELEKIDVDYDVKDVFSDEHKTFGKNNEMELGPWEFKIYEN
jgi:glycosidase